MTAIISWYKKGEEDIPISELIPDISSNGRENPAFSDTSGILNLDFVMSEMIERGRSREVRRASRPIRRISNASNRDDWEIDLSRRSSSEIDLNSRKRNSIELNVQPDPPGYWKIPGEN